MVIAGGALGIVSTVLEISATGNLKTAVRRYNVDSSIANRQARERIRFRFSGNRVGLTYQW
jgi:hypothetical protein